MTHAQIAELIGYINLRWPHAPLEANVHPIWVEDLASIDQGAAHAAVKAFALAGERFPPTSGQVLAECQRSASDGPPSFDEVSDITRWIPMRVFLRELYDPNGVYSPDSTARAVELMMQAGAHEAACRFVQERGLGAVLAIPDGARYALDMGQQADRRDALRHYQGVTLPGWQRDPSPGLAWARAQRAVGAVRRAELRPVGELTEGGE